ncbi:MAG: prolyl oligopeptidase family serine peptidase [Ignavibacteria bacterium]
MIISQETVSLSEIQKKMVSSGWGREVLENTEVKKIIYESDGVNVNGYMAHPKINSQKLPLIIWNRGGHLKDGIIDDFLAKGIFGEIASWGYVVLASNYRDEDEFGGKDINDVIKLFAIADEIDFCDPLRIGMEGWSRGGMMTYQVLRKTDKIKCAVIISGLADLLRSEENRSDLVEVYKKLFGSHNVEEFKKRKEDRSAICFANEIDRSANILLIHGKEDKKISYKDSEDMYFKLKKNNVNSELELIEGGDHYLRKQRKEVATLRRNWFEKYLK